VRRLERFAVGRLGRLLITVQEGARRIGDEDETEIRASLAIAQVVEATQRGDRATPLTWGNEQTTSTP